MTAISGPVVPGVCGGICAFSDVGAGTTHAAGANTGVGVRAAAGASGGGSSSGRLNTHPQDSHSYRTMTGSPDCPATRVRYLTHRGHNCDRFESPGLVLAMRAVVKRCNSRSAVTSRRGVRLSVRQALVVFRFAPVDYTKVIRRSDQRLRARRNPKSL